MNHNNADFLIIFCCCFRTSDQKYLTKKPLGCDERYTHFFVFMRDLLYTLFKWWEIYGERRKNSQKSKMMVDFKVEEEFTYPKSQYNCYPKLIQCYDIFLRIYSVSGMYHLENLFKWKKKRFCKYLLNTKPLTTSVWIWYIIQ